MLQATANKNMNQWLSNGNKFTYEQLKAMGVQVEIENVLDSIVSDLCNRGLVNRKGPEGKGDKWKVDLGKWLWLFLPMNRCSYRNILIALEI